MQINMVNTPQQKHTDTLLKFHSEILFCHHYYHQHNFIISINIHAIFNYNYSVNRLTLLSVRCQILRVAEGRLPQYGLEGLTCFWALFFLPEMSLFRLLPFINYFQSVKIQGTGHVLCSSSKVPGSQSLFSLYP